MTDPSSRQAYSAALERLDGYAPGKDASVVAQTADEIVAVARLLTRQPRLRRLLSDPARAGEERIGLLRGLLDGKVGADALGLLATLVGGRWSAPLELLNATERLGVEALLASAENAGDLAEVEDELFRFGQVVDANPRLAATLGDSTAPAGRRGELVRDLLTGPAGSAEPTRKARPATVRLAELALAGFAGRSFAGALTRLVEFAADRRDRQVAYVVVAAPISEDQERRLGDTLSGMYGRGVTLKVTVDPSVIGGISLRVGHDLYDGTIASRLVQTRNALVGR